MQEDPFLIVEALTPKSRGKWKAISSYQSDEEEDGGAGGGAGAKKGLVEVEFVKNKKLSWGEQMGIVVGILLRDGKEGLIRWIIEVSLSFIMR